MIISNEQIKALKPYINNIEELIEKGDIEKTLDEIDNVIIDNILGNNDEPDEEGIYLQRIYDEIAYQNS